MRIAITGVTGLLGRNLLFELLKQNLNDLAGLEIFVLGRPAPPLMLDERIDEILREDGAPYCGVGAFEADAFLEEVRPHVWPTMCDLGRDDLGLSPEDYERLNEAPLDFFFHVAALTDLRDSPQIRENLEDTNVRGTRRLLHLLAHLNLRQVVYVGSAFSCGSVEGVAEPDDVDLDRVFRSPYERTKVRCEVAFRSFVERHRLHHRVFRPAILCGRLIEEPIGAMSKFDVFYGWAAFFVRHKLAVLGDRPDICTIPYELPIRIHINPRSGQNIVPVDYAAKAMVAECMHGGRATSYHLASDAEIPHRDYIPWLLDGVGIRGCTFVDEEPTDKTPHESLYYRTVGRVFTPYVTSQPTHFSLASLDASRRFGPGIWSALNREQFARLMPYAQERRFGVGVRTAVTIESRTELS
jgi:nucleoside-diphosphate-sugar epimerase